MFTRENYTDPQGTTHPLAIFEVANVNFSKNVSKSTYQDVSQGMAQRAFIDNENTHISLDYRVYYWTSQAAYDADAMPYTVMNAEPMGEVIYADINGLPGYDTLSIEQQAEKHFQEVFLA